MSDCCINSAGLGSVLHLSHRVWNMSSLLWSPGRLQRPQQRAEPSITGPGCAAALWAASLGWAGLGGLQVAMLGTECSAPSRGRLHSLPWCSGWAADVQPGPLPGCERSRHCGRDSGWHSHSQKNERENSDPEGAAKRLSEQRQLCVR